jgi:hypothetical protein
MMRPPQEILLGLKRRVRYKRLITLLWVKIPPLIMMSLFQKLESGVLMFWLTPILLQVIGVLISPFLRLIPFSLLG